MKKFFFVFFLFLFFPNITLAAISFGDVTVGKTTQTYSSPTVAGSNVVGVVVVRGDSGSDSVTGVTWDGVSMTKIGSRQVPSDNRYVSVWCIQSPTTGTIAFTGGSFWHSVAAFYTGAVCPPADGTGTGSVSSNTVQSISVTVSTNNAWLILGAANGSGSRDYTATGDLTEVRLDNSSNAVALLDSGGSLSVGSRTASYTVDSSTNLAGVAFSLSPYVDVTPPDEGGGGMTILSSALVGVATSTCYEDASNTVCVWELPVDVTYYDWLLMNGFIFFVLCFILWGYFFSTWRGKRKHNL